MVQALLAQAAQRLARMPGEQQLLHLVEQPRGRHVLDQLGEPRDRFRRLLLDREAELRREPHRAQHAHRILAIARDRRADQLHAPRAHVGDAADVIPDFLGRRIEIQRVDREVAPRRIFRLRPVDVVRDQPAMLVGRVVAGLRGAKRRHLDHFVAGVHVHEPEAAADDVRAPEQRLDLLRMRVGRDVEVLRLDAEHEVAHRAADDEGLESRFLQLARDRPRACAAPGCARTGCWSLV